jgi:hypothetical protein
MNIRLGSTAEAPEVTSGADEMLVTAPWVLVAAPRNSSA